MNNIDTSVPDYQHRDWLLFSTQKLIQELDPAITVEIITSPNGSKRLFASQISEESINKLYFITNTDQNNNYLYLEDFQVYISGNSTPIQIPGFSQTAINMFRRSDIISFVEGRKLHFPFSPENLRDSTYTGKTFSGFVDVYTGLIPYIQGTEGYVKTYEIILNPDNVDVVGDSGSARKVGDSGSARKVGDSGSARK